MPVFGSDRRSSARTRGYHKNVQQLDESAGDQYGRPQTFQAHRPSAPSHLSTLSTISATGQYTDLLNAPALAPVATSGSYASLTSLPPLGTPSGWMAALECWREHQPCFLRHFGDGYGAGKKVVSQERAQASPCSPYLQATAPSTTSPAPAEGRVPACSGDLTLIPC